jgi:hypothetical protein
MQNAKMEIPQNLDLQVSAYFGYTTLAHEEQLDTLHFSEGGAREEDKRQGIYSCCIVLLLVLPTYVKLVPVHTPQFTVEQNLWVGRNFPLPNYFMTVLSIILRL